MKFRTSLKRQGEEGASESVTKADENYMHEAAGFLVRMLQVRGDLFLYSEDSEIRSLQC
jgi:hypothetical protein